MVYNTEFGILLFTKVDVVDLSIKTAVWLLQNACVVKMLSQANFPPFRETYTHFLLKNLWISETQYEVDMIFVVFFQRKLCKKEVLKFKVKVY